MNLDAKEFSENWTVPVSPFADILEKVKIPQPKLSVIEMIFCGIIKDAVSGAQKSGLTEPVDIAAYIVGYMSSMRMLPK